MSRYAHLSFQYHKHNSIKTLHNTSRIIMQSSGEVSTLAGSECGIADGKGRAAMFYSPRGIWYDSSDESLVVCDTGNSRLRRVRLNGMWSNPLFSSWFFFFCFVSWWWNAGEVTTLCVIGSPVEVVLTANNTLMVSTASHQIYKVTQKGTHIALLVMMSHAHTSYQALMAMRWLSWQDLEIEGEWMEGLMSANSVIHVEWQWMNWVTLALLLTRWAVQSEGWLSKTDERCCWSASPPLLLVSYFSILSHSQSISSPFPLIIQYIKMREERKKIRRWPDET